MCTVTYFPLKNGALFSSNRDESPNRKLALLPAVYAGKNNSLLYPADGVAGGTWIGLNNHGTLLILLNGGFVNHERNPPYRISRGLVVKQLLDSNRLFAEWNQVDLTGVEPFTLIACTEKNLHQLVWTGKHKIATEPGKSHPLIWSSATLYTPEVQAERQHLFNSFSQQHPEPTSKQLQGFLQQAKDSANGFVMNRNNLVKTCSISLVHLKEQQAFFEYNDLLQNVSTELIFPIASAAAPVNISIAKLQSNKTHLQPGALNS